MKNEVDAEPHNSNLEPRTSNFNWPRLYAAVLAFLAFQILVFFIFTKAFQ